MQMWRGRIATCLPSSSTVQPLSFISQSMKAPTASGSDSSIRQFTTLSVVAIGPGNRQSDDRRPPRDLGPPGLERNVRGLAPIRAGAHDRGEGRIDEGLQTREAAEARGEVEEFGACCQQSVLHFLIDGHVGTAEAVDRLLGITDEEQLSWNATDIAPISLARIIGSEQQEDLGLERVGVLELVDEEMGEALLQLGDEQLPLSRMRSRALIRRSRKSSRPAFAFNSS